MINVTSEYLNYDWLFSKYKGLSSMYEWFSKNIDKYDFLKSIKLFKKYYYIDDFLGGFEIFFVGACKDDTEENIVNLCCFKKASYGYICEHTFPIILENGKVKFNCLKNHLYDKYKPEQFLKKEDFS